jgi:hypothetical protein
LDDNVDYLNILDDETIDDDGNTSSLAKKNEKAVGKKKDKVWDYFKVINIPNNPHKGATCKFCSQSWKRGKPSDIKAHLALKCPRVTNNVRMEYLHAVSNEDISEQLIQEQSNNKSNNKNVIDIAKADKTLIRFFVCCGIPFSIVDSPFF